MTVSNEGPVLILITYTFSQREKGRPIIRQELSPLLLVVLCLSLLFLHQLDAAAAAFPSYILAIVYCSSL